MDSNCRLSNWNFIRFNSAKVAFKGITWHQDMQTPYEEFEILCRRYFVTIWIPITGVLPGNSMELVRGSHSPRHIYPNHFRSDLSLPLLHREKEVYQVECDVGDVVLLDPFTFHRSGPSNDTGLARISLDLRYIVRNKVKYTVSPKLWARTYFRRLKDIVRGRRSMGYAD